MRTLIAIAVALAAVPALAQTTTTVTTQPQQAPPPPPSTQVVVQPGENTVPVAAEPVGVTTVSSGRSAAAIIATDAVFGGLAGGLIGGGVTLIDQGNHWERDLMVGAGVGILVGAAIGVYEAANQPSPVVRRAAADPDPSASNTGTQLAALSGRF